MSILIKMEMPKKCEECPCYYYEYKECNALGWIRVNGNATPPTDCPLIELPPHGDLIDRDALMKDGWLALYKRVYKRVDYMCGYAIHELPLNNPSIPVVLESEE